MSKEEKLKKAQSTVKDINKLYGDNSIILMSDKPHIDLNVIPSGSLGLDIALGVGGYPKGRIVEIFGPESSGKTTMCLHAIAECQKIGGIAAIIDAEHALDPVYAEALGINTEELFISQPDSGEEALNITQKVIESGCYDIVVVDSVAALVPKAELEGEMGDSKMGVHARLMSQAMRKLTAITHKSDCLVIFINQLRDKIGVMYGDPSTTTGGNALKFFASVRLDVRRSLTTENSVMEGKEKIGNKTTVKVIKNKVASPFKSADFDILYGKGIDRFGEVINYAVKFDIIKRGGAWYNYEGGKFQGIKEVEQFLKDNPEVYNEIESQIKKHIYG